MPHFRSLVMLIALLFVAFAVNGQSKQIGEVQNNKAEAKRIWELAVEAQGGREKLLTLQNLVISSLAKFQLSLFKKHTNRNESFYVFPNKTWAWEDYRPSVLGLTMKMYNWETGKKYVFSPSPRMTTSESFNQLESIEQIDMDRSKDKNGEVTWRGLVIYLLESKWWKPIPEALSVGKINSQKVDIIQATIDGKRMDFFLNQNDHLPMRISFYNLTEIANITDITVVEVSDYTVIDGFNVPTKLKETDGTMYDLTYQFNVVYNEDIFKTPPPFEAGPEAWKAKK